MMRLAARAAEVTTVDPHPPVWLPDISLKNLHVGRGVVDLRFHRASNGDTDYEVLEKRGPLHVARQPSPGR